MPVRAAYIMKTQESASDKRVRAGERDVALLSDSLVYHLFVGVKYLYRCYHILLLFSRISVFVFCTVFFTLQNRFSSPKITNAILLVYLLSHSLNIFATAVHSRF